MGAGSLMKNVKDASAKVVETVSAYVRFVFSLAYSLGKMIKGVDILYSILVCQNIATNKFRNIIHNNHPLKIFTFFFNISER
jgi:hypothetical protein